MNDETMQPRRRLHAIGRQARRERIFDRIRRGLSYDEIARKEGLSVQHVRRVVAQALKEREAHTGADHAKLQLDRLGLALLIASKAVAAGERRAVAPFLKALDRLDRYHKLAREHQDENEDVRRKLIDKINFAAANLGYDEEAAAEPAGQEA
jgi:DNA-binding CsgD family transcriptional regulator